MDRFYFDIDDLRQKAIPADKSSVVKEKFITYHEAKVESIKRLVQVPGDGEIYFIWTDNSFNAFTFIPYTIKQLQYIEELIISTYSINSRIIDSLIRYMDKGLIKSVVLLISDSLKFRMPKVVDNLESLSLQRENIEVRYSWNHSKITLMRTGENYFVVEGSGNWSENSRHEQYIFLNNKNVFEFRKTCMNEAIRVNR